MRKVYSAKRIAKLVNYCLIGFSIVVTGLLWGLNFFHTSKVAYRASEQVEISLTIELGITMAIGSVLVLFVLSLLWQKLKIVNCNVLFICLSVFYAIMATYLLLNIDNEIRADAASVFLCST